MKYSIVNYRKIIKSNDLLRYDAEFYKLEFLNAEKKVKSQNHDELRNLIEILTDYHANGSYEKLRDNVKLLDKPDYALMIRTVDLERNEFENNTKHISEHAYNFLKKTKVYGGDIVINKIGNAGRVYIVPPLNRKISLGMNQLMIRPNKRINGNFLYTFLISKHGQSLMKQKVTGAVPLSIDKESVRSVFIPLLDEKIQLKIDILIKEHFKESLKSKSLYSEAEKLLLSELGLEAWKPKHKLSFVKNFSETIKVERFDAEYFQPQYDEILEAISKHSSLPLGELVEYEKGIEPGSEAYEEEGVPFVRVSDVSTNGIDRIEKSISKNLASEYTGRFSPRKGDILFTKDGTIGISFVVEENINSVLSGAFLRLILKEENIEREYLALVLNSVIGKQQVKKLSGGAIIAHLKPSEAMSFEIPLLPTQIQKEISKKVIASRIAREESKKLLEKAKRAVEIAIEENEEEAMKFLNN